MRRILVAAVTTSALALPGVALAHGSAHSHAAGHGARHAGRHHHHRAHLLDFHAQAPATTPSAGTTPTTPVAEERAGTIASFTAGTLTITLNDGSSVSGKVGSATEIECHSAMASAADNGNSGSNATEGEHGDRSGSSAGEGQPGDGSGHDESEHEAGDDEGEHEAESCSMTALVPGASVREAVLSVSSAGTFWVKLEL